MIGVIYLGTNTETQERLKYIPGRLVQFTDNYKNAASACVPHVRNEHFIVFFEQTERTEDVTAITYIRKKSKSAYIILLTRSDLSVEDRKIYQKCGINDTIAINASVTELNKKIQFIADREGMLFDDQQPRYRMLRFKIPVWKRLFDIFFSALGIIILSPVFIITAIAIRLESKGPVIYKSKRVGTNYTIFDFLKFRSMYVDAEQRLKEVAKEEGNQYAEKGEEEQKANITAPLGEEAEMMMMNMGMESRMPSSRLRTTRVSPRWASSSARPASTNFPNSSISSRAICPSWATVPSHSTRPRNSLPMPASTVSWHLQVLLDSGKWRNVARAA